MPDPTGYFQAQQSLGAAQPPQYILDLIGPYDQSRFSWDPNTMSLWDNLSGGSYSYGHINDPSLGTDVVTDLTSYNQQGLTPENSQHFGAGEQPFFGFGDDQQTFISADPQAIADWRHDSNTRSRQGATQVAALVGGGAALGGLLGSGAAGGGLAPVTTGGATMLPGGVPSVAAASFGGTTAATPLAAMPAFGGLAGAGGAASAIPSSGILDSSGVAIPGTESVGNSLFSDRLTQALGSFGDIFGGGAIPGGAAGGGGNPELMSMMQALLQRQRIPTPQGPMGPRYKPYG